MSERGELAELIASNLDRLFGKREFGPAQQDIDLADELLAAGYRKPRTVTTTEELDALLVGSVVLALADGHAMMGDYDARFKWPHAYESFADEPGFWFSTIDGDGFGSAQFFYDGAPAVTVLHEAVAE
jgi:hypothetical protein